MGEMRQCRQCRYWKRLSWAGGSRRACHYLLETGRLRQTGENGTCKSFQKKGLTNGKRVKHWK